MRDKLKVHKRGTRTQIQRGGAPTKVVPKRRSRRPSGVAVQSVWIPLQAKYHGTTFQPPLTHSLTHVRTHPPTHSLTHVRSHPLTHSVTLSPTHSQTESVSQSVGQSVSRSVSHSKLNTCCSHRNTLLRCKEGLEETARQTRVQGQPDWAAVCPEPAPVGSAATSRDGLQ